MINSDNSPDISPEIARLMQSLPNSSIAISKVSREPSRLYDVFVYNREGFLIEKHMGISPQLAGRIRNENHFVGNRVDRIESSSLSGEVNPVEFIPPEQHHSTVIDKPEVFISKYNLRTARNNAKYQQEFFRKANKQLKMIADSKINILVYEKISGKLRFSGTLEDAGNYIFDMMEAGIWNMNSWVIYLPVKKGG